MNNALTKMDEMCQMKSMERRSATCKIRRFFIILGKNRKTKMSLAILLSFDFLEYKEDGDKWVHTQKLKYIIC